MLTIQTVLGRVGMKTMQKISKRIWKHMFLCKHLFLKLQVRFDYFIPMHFFHKSFVPLVYCHFCCTVLLSKILTITTTINNESLLSKKIPVKAIADNITEILW